MKTPGPIRDFALKIRSAEGRALIVGGAVRDSLIGLAPKDFDIEVYGIEPDSLLSLLEESYEVDTVGKAFGILSVTMAGIEGRVDVALPRRESKTGLGHKGFEVLSDPDMTVREAARRRDLTINALAYDPLNDIIIDHFGGLDDIERKVLRATDHVQFAEDPLRVLRAAQFAARLRFHPTPGLVNVCSWLDLGEIVPDRIGAEWEKLLMKGAEPSRGIFFLRECKQLGHAPELAALDGCLQEPEWHPEGDALVHTAMVCDEAAYIARRDGVVGDAKRALMYGALCHDLGKPSTTEVIDGRIRSIGRTQSGVEPTVSLLKSWVRGHDLIAKVVPLVREHLVHLNVGDSPSDRSIRRLAKRLEPATIATLVRVIEADASGRSPSPKCSPAFPMLMAASRLYVKDGAPAPIVMGRHLIEAGLEPGKSFGKLLAAAYEAQLDGVFDNVAGGLDYLHLQ